MEHHILRLRGGASDGGVSAGDTVDTADTPDLSTGYLNIFAKNARSLQSDERLEELLIEVDQVEWDVVLVSETWREEVEEYDTLESKHIWFGSGGTRGKHGVGILVHKRWSNHVRGWRAINTRIGVLDIDVGPWKLSVFVVYMPHGGKSDICLEEVYSTISTLVKEARSAKRMTILGGDWNAEVESAAWESHATVGAFANPKGNARGEWLHRWATSERLIIANTLFKKRWGCRWSHIQHGRKRTIEYLYGQVFASQNGRCRCEQTDRSRIRPSGSLCSAEA